MRELLQSQAEPWIFFLHWMLLQGSLIQVMCCNGLFEDCPLHSSSSLLGEDSSSLKDQSHCLNLKKKLKGNPGWWQSQDSGVYGSWRSWMCLGFSWLCFLCSRSCWSESGSGPWNSGLSDVCGRSGECGMGCNYASWMCHSGNGIRASTGLKGGMSCCSSRCRVWCVPSETATPVTRRMVVGFWSAEMYPMSGTIVSGVWPVPPGILMPWTRSVLVVWCSWGKNLVGTVLCKVAQFITAITLCISEVVAKMTCLSTNKTSIIIGHHTDPDGCQYGCKLLCCIEFSTNLMTSAKVWRWWCVCSEFLQQKCRLPQCHCQKFIA